MKHIKFLLVCLLLLFAMPVYAKTMKFVVVSDIHYSPGAIQSGSRNISNAGKALNGFINQVNNEKYDFVVFLGDCIDKSRKDDLYSFLGITKNIKAPYYYTLGNHDAHKISGMTQQEYMEIISLNNPNQKKPDLSYVFYPKPGFAAIVLNNVPAFAPGSHGYLTQKTLKWLDKTLANNTDKDVLIFQHVPYKPPYIDPTHNIVNIKEFEEVISKYDNIKMIASGHYHKLAVNEDEKGIYHFSAPPLFEEPYQYSVITVEYNRKPFAKPQNIKFSQKTLNSI